MSSTVTPAPKPRRRPKAKAAPSSLARKTPLQRRSGPTRTGRVKPRNAKRRAESFERAYGGEARVRWMHQQPSVVSGRTPCVCSHVRNGGRGRKADACWTVPMLLTEEREYHAIGKRAFEAKYGVDMDALAQATEAAWQAENAR